jgi:AcrR family transcriptional regulator
MSALAESVGTSRQTVYNEVGSKADLAEAMILSELAGFLAVVEQAFDAHPDDAIEAVRAAVNGVLELAAEHVLLRAIVASTYGADTELLPLLTTRSLSVLEEARSVLAHRLIPPSDVLGRHRRDAVVDAIVRTVLSHVMQPTGTPAATADDVAWITERLLAPAS